MFIAAWRTEPSGTLKGTSVGRDEELLLIAQDRKSLQPSPENFCASARPFLKSRYDPALEVQALSNINKHVEGSRFNDGGLLCRFCHSRWAIVNGKTTKPALAKMYTAAQFVLHVHQHINDFPTATDMFVMGTLASELDTSPSFCAALIDHVCQFDKQRNGRKKTRL